MNGIEKMRDYYFNNYKNWFDDWLDDVMGDECPSVYGLTDDGDNCTRKCKDCWRDALGNEVE